jgi:hypothetical protein
MHLTRALKSIPIAALTFGVALGCNDFLTGGDLSNDPNNPTKATNSQLFVGTQSFLWSFMESDAARLTGIFAQHFEGSGLGYLSIQTYDIDESTTNGLHQSTYLTGGLVDLRKLQAGTRAVGDSIFTGMAQVEEAMLVGTAADIFGDIVYSNALSGPNPAPDPQLEIYDRVQTLLDDAIENLAATGPTNFGPGPADLNYGGDPEQWTKLAYTLKARFYLHTAEVRGATAYSSALAAAQKGMTTSADDYKAVFSGGAGEENFYSNFVKQRAGYLLPNQFFVDLLETRGDPRLADYFNAEQTNLSDERLDPGYDQPIVTANENLLVWAEALQRGGQDGPALTKLNQARALAGLGALSGLTGKALLGEILTEKYIALFQTIEPFNDYKRTCFPNLTSNVAGQIIPARLFYDVSEVQTNTSLKKASEQPRRNANDLPNATDDVTGAACTGQLGGGT